MSLTQKYSLAFKMLDNPLKNTMTSSFRTTSRNHKPSHASRYVRDFNDLNYEIPSTFSTRKSETKSHKRIKVKNKNQNPEKQSVFKISPPKELPKTSRFGVEANAYKVREFFRSTGVTIDDGYDQAGSKVSSPSPLKDEKQDFGLCGFEFQKTIAGKIEKRQSHHIVFEKSPRRKQNINKIWYSKECEYSATDREERAKDLKHRIHPFKSDSTHKVFVPRESLQKIYNVQKPINLVRQRSDINVRQMERVKSRPELDKKLGTQLTYNKSQSLLTKKMPLFRISRMERNLQYSRQIISPERGCYR